VHHGDDYQLTLELLLTRCATYCSCASLFTAASARASFSRQLGSTAVTTMPGSMTGGLRARRGIRSCALPPASHQAPQLRVRRRLRTAGRTSTAITTDLCLSSQPPTARSQSAPRRAPTTACRARFCRQPKRGLHAGAHRARRRLRCATERFLAGWRALGRDAQPPSPGRDARRCCGALGRHPQDSRGSCLSGRSGGEPSVPWGNSTDSLGGYHLVWPRDATLTALALLAANQRLDARHILSHLIARSGARDTGRRTISRAASRTGAAFSSMKWPCPCCSLPSWASSASRSCRARLRWCARRSASSPAPDPPVPRTAGKRIPG